MNPFARIAAAAIVVVAVLGGALYLTAPGGGVGGVPPGSVAPSATGSAPPSAVPSATPSPAELPSPVSTTNWVPFSSARYGYDMFIPPTWTPYPSTRTWTFSTDQNDWLTTAADGFRPPDDSVYVSAFAAAVPAGMSNAEWMAAFQGPDSKGTPNACDPKPVDLAMPTVDGHPVSFTRAKVACGETQAFVFVGSRVYVISVWIDGQEPLLKAFLSTVRFRPDLPSGSAGPSPG